MSVWMIKDFDVQNSSLVSTRWRCVNVCLGMIDTILDGKD